MPLVTQLLFASFVLPMLLGGGVSKFSMALAALTLHTACWPRCCAARCKPSRRARWRRPARWAWAPPWPTGSGRRPGIAAPAALGVFVGAVKDTSLVSIIGVFDVLGAAKAVVAGTAWRPLSRRGLAVAAGRRGQLAVAGGAGDGEGRL